MLSVELLPVVMMPVGKLGVLLLRGFVVDEPLLDPFKAWIRLIREDEPALDRD
jgi:hypothetical protein